MFINTPLSPLLMGCHPDFQQQQSLYMDISLEVKATKINICQGTKYWKKFYISSVDSAIRPEA